MMAGIRNAPGLNAEVTKVSTKDTENDIAWLSGFVNFVETFVNFVLTPG